MKTEFLTTKQVGEFLGLSKRESIINWLVDNKVPYMMIGNRIRKYDIADVRKAAEMAKVKIE